MSDEKPWIPETLLSPWIPETLLSGIGARLVESGRKNEEARRAASLRSEVSEPPDTDGDIMREPDCDCSMGIHGMHETDCRFYSAPRVIETPPSEPWPFNHAEFRLKVQDGMRCSWGVYGVHPYLEGALKACDRIDELLKANGYIASEAIRLTDENESLTAQLEAANKVVEAAEQLAEVVDRWANQPATWTSDGQVARALSAYRALSSYRRSPDSNKGE
jgi:hypothetical protein